MTRAQALTVLSRYSGIPVREVMRTPGPACEAVCEIAKGSRTNWTLREWLGVVDTLAVCDSPVSAWLVVA